MSRAEGSGHVRLEDRIRALAAEGKTLSSADRLRDWAYHSWDLRYAALKIEITCIGATELGELAARAGITAVTDPSTYAMQGIAIGAGLACGYALALATHLGGTHCCHPGEHEQLSSRGEGSAWTTVKDSLSSAYRGLGELYKAASRQGTAPERAARWDAIKSGARHVTLGELFGCIGIGAVTQNIIGNYLGGNTLQLTDPSFWGIWTIASLPAYAAAAAFIAASYGYDAHKECMGEKKTPHAH